MIGRYLLDTNILSDLIRHPQGRIASCIEDVGEEQVCTSIIVLSELRYGIAKRASSRLAAQLTLILTRFDVLAFEAPADVTYGDLRARLEQAGNLIGPHDLLIAAQALALGLIVVTDNEREFLRVPGLRVENWLRALPN